MLCKDCGNEAFSLQKDVLMKNGWRGCLIAETILLGIGIAEEAFSWNRSFRSWILILMFFFFMIAFTIDKRWRKRIRTEAENALDKADLSSFQNSDAWKSFPEHQKVDELFRKKISEENEKRDVEEYDRQATLEALQSQINPHFLYNTLECIRGQAMLDDNRDIAEMLEKLGSFFRYSISRKDNIVTLFDELQNIRSYMYIQNYRFSNHYQLDIIFEEDQKELELCAVPKLMLQPIVENSILHAFENRIKGTITISIDADEKELVITVSDDGIGMDPDTLQNLNDRIAGKQDSIVRPLKSHGNGIALENVNKRIGILFGQNYGMHVYSTPGSGTDVEIFLPKISNPWERNGI